MAEENDFTLHTELADDAKRLVTHPVKEAERLEHEAAVGEADTTPLILIGEVALFVALLVVVLVAVLFTISSLIGSLHAV
jgi:hypothetical protein